MTTLATTTLSSKGQVVIPEAVRRRLGLKAGDQFVVVGEGDVVVLKAVQAPPMSQFDALVADARKGARKAGMPRAAVARAVTRARRSG